MDKLVYVFNNLFGFVFSFSLIIIVLYFVFSFYAKKFNPKNKKISFYGIFLSLKEKDIFSISILTVRYIFIIWCIFSKDINTVHLCMLIIPGLTYNILNKRIFNGIFDIVSNLIIYLCLGSKVIFYNYLVEIEIVWYVVVILFLLIIFILLYYSYFLLKDIDFVVRQNQYIDKKHGKK